MLCLLEYFWTGTFKSYESPEAEQAKRLPGLGVSVIIGVLVTVLLLYYSKFTIKPLFLSVPNFCVLPFL